MNLLTQKNSDIEVCQLLIHPKETRRVWKHRSKTAKKILSMKKCCVDVKDKIGVPAVAQWVNGPACLLWRRGLIPGQGSGLRIWHCGCDRGYSSNFDLWCRNFHMPRRRPKKQIIIIKTIIKTLPISDKQRVCYLQTYMVRSAKEGFFQAEERWNQGASQIVRRNPESQKEEMSGYIEKAYFFPSVLKIHTKLKTKE